MRPRVDGRKSEGQLERQALVIRVGTAGRDSRERTAGKVADAAATRDVFEERLLAEGGRGIMIMASWMDRVIYNRQGNEVLLVKRLEQVK